MRKPMRSFVAFFVCWLIYRQRVDIIINKDNKDEKIEIL